ncbi:hypothetical protein [Ornithinimicrobium kibberense]|uniref:hypothetical protein n=1 Tax=Ornithinimicrobium kibberense TaxID=282060 RepID=UPI00361798F1
MATNGSSPSSTCGIQPWAKDCSTSRATASSTVPSSGRRWRVIRARTSRLSPSSSTSVPRVTAWVSTSKPSISSVASGTPRSTSSVVTSWVQAESTEPTRRSATRTRRR